MKSVDTIRNLRQETVDSEPQLEELIDLTAEIMLSPAGRAKIAATNATDPEYPQYVDNAWLTQYRTGDPGDKKKRLPPIELKNIQINSATARRIELLGETILEEAFECLGESAVEILEEFKKCKDDETDKKALLCNSILYLIEDFSEKATFAFKEEDEVEDYSPMRLSPNLIGKLPNPELNPTCLGQSILAASFFHKAGVPMLHSGVVISKTDNELTSQSTIIRDLLEYVEKNNLNISPNFRYRIAEMHDENAKKLSDHRGFHAAVYAQLGQESWIQLDPNYGCALIEGGVAMFLEDSYKKLNEHQVVGAEDHIYLGGNVEDVGLFIARGIPDIMPSIDELEQILMNCPPEEMYSYILAEVFKPFLFKGVNTSTDKAILKIERDVKMLLDIIGGGYGYLQERISEVVRNSFVNSDYSPDMLMGFKRFQSDAEFRQRRLADLQIAPMILAIQIQSDFVDAKTKRFNSGGLGHTFVDAGLPAYRIGMSVMSDVAVHYGDELPLSTWLGYWPSKVSLFEHRDQALTDSQKSLRKAAAHYALKGSRTLTNQSAIGIIESILTDSYQGE
ncbi:MAG: hypothetical protein Q7T74_01130 [Candidatus Saccharibacteria bacterium]|nr:hypothetical protein [Candidatus Saccharibacteria bacterium]